MKNISALCVPADSTLREVISCIDRGAKGIALVLDSHGRLLGTITDGDVRRAILAGVDLDLQASEILNRRPNPQKAFTAPIGTADAELLHVMNQHAFRHIPLVDENERVVEVSLLSELAQEYELPLRALVMAGGYGSRLRPLTDEVPKPMLPVGDKPLLELIVEQLRDAGIRQVNLATHYKGEVIAEHFKDGQDFGVEIRYVKEDQPLGTAGAVGMIGESEEPLLVINGDILTGVNFRALLNFHKEHNADLTIAVRQYEFHVPYGVVETNGVVVTGMSEKPVVRQFINAGIYLLSPSVFSVIPNGRAFDIPELLSQLLLNGSAVVCFPIREYWLDIGRTDHYEKAQEDMRNGRVV
jgi:dTDP-glucose pyrophosphorylase